MAVILPLGRTLSRQAIPRFNSVLTRLASANSTQHASYSTTDGQFSFKSCRVFPDRKVGILLARRYATTAASKPVGRPKAHTGRATAKKGTTKAKSATTRTKATTKKTKAKPKPKAKPKTKPKARKSAPKEPSKAALNRARIARDKDLKAKALLTEPKQLPATAWAVYFSQTKSGVKDVKESANRTKEAAQDFKQLPSEELEKLNHTANQNKAKNESAYKRWVAQHTPVEVKAANNARNLLNKEKKAKEGKKKASIRLIKDDRLVKQSRNAYSYFLKDRFATGDFKHMTITEASRLIAREWKELSEADRKPFFDQQKADHNRYVEESTSVYGSPPSQRKSSSK